jgi:hypothetical protein
MNSEPYKSPNYDNRVTTPSEEFDIDVKQMVSCIVDSPISHESTIINQESTILSNKFDELKLSLDNFINKISEKIIDHDNVLINHKYILDLQSVNFSNSMTRIIILENNLRMHVVENNANISILKEKMEFNNTVRDFNKERVSYLENRIKHLENITDDKKYNTNTYKPNQSKYNRQYSRDLYIPKNTLSETRRNDKSTLPASSAEHGTLPASSAEHGTLPESSAEHSTLMFPINTKPIERKNINSLINNENMETGTFKMFPLSMSLLNTLLSEKCKPENEIKKEEDNMNNNNDENYDGSANVYIDEKDKPTEDELKELNDIGKINNIDDMINIGTELKEKIVNKVDEFYIVDGKKYSINTNILVKLVQPLTRLKRLVGMSKVKNEIFDMIVYYIQEFKKKDELLHTTIEGPPGVGKTRLGKIMAELFSAMEIIPSARFTMIKRTDLIGQYLGHTAIKTQKVLDDADGGVLFLDEAYSLGDSCGKDSFAKEAIDVINQNLSENKKKLIVIVAGYEDQLEKCFFSLNAGLERRFPFRYKIDGYDEKEMTDILYDRIRHIKWKLSNELSRNFLEKFFKKNELSFVNYGGDIETLILRCKFKHGRRVLGKHPKLKTILTMEDFISGFKDMKDNKRKDDISHLNMFI